MKDSNGDLTYFLTDHLVSVVAITDNQGNLISQQRYLPFGGVRTNVTTPNSPNTDFGYTGQRNLDEDIGLMDYKARFYSPVLNRFIQPDSIIPETYNPQTWNRYSYVYNRPINFNDPTGHCADPLTGTACLTIGLIGLGFVAAVWTVAYVTNPNVKDATDQLVNSVGGEIRKTKKDYERRVKNLNNFIDGFTRPFDDSEKNPKFDFKKACKENKVACIVGVVAFSIFVVTTSYKIFTCSADESSCTYDQQPGRLVVPSKTPTPTPTIPFNNYEDPMQNLPGYPTLSPPATGQPNQQSTNPNSVPSTPSYNYRNPTVVPY